MIFNIKVHWKSHIVCIKILNQKLMICVPCRKLPINILPHFEQFILLKSGVQLIYECGLFQVTSEAPDLMPNSSSDFSTYTR